MNKAASKDVWCGVLNPAMIMGIPRPALRNSTLVRVFLLLWLGMNAASASFAATALLHKAAPEFVRTDLNHRRLDLLAYRGRIVLLNFWATWCAPCQLEMPRFVAWQKQYGPRGLQIIGVSMDDDSATASSLVKKLKLNYPVVMGDEKLGQLYGGVMGLPMTFLIDSRGRIKTQYQGETDLNSIEEQFKPLLRP